MESENTHWRQLCPSIFDIEAGHGISKICCITFDTVAYLYSQPQKLPQGKRRRRGKQVVRDITWKIDRPLRQLCFL